MVGMKTIVRAAALSGGWKIPDDYQVVFRPLWQLSEEQKSDVSDKDTKSVIEAEASGLITQKTALKEMKQNAKVTGRFTNVTDEDIEAASDDLAPRGQDAIDQERDALVDRQSALGEKDDQGSNDPKDPKEPKGFKDKTHDVSLPISELFGLPIAIESPKGTLRKGADEDGQRWSCVMPADYGYIRRAPSAEGEQEWMDCFVGDNRTSECPAHVIDGYTPVGMFDEHKVMLGFDSPQDALRCFHEAYNDGRRAGSVTTMSHDELREWLASGEVMRPLGRRNLRLAANDARAA